MAMRITTTPDAIAALGGTEAVRELTGRQPKAISNWRARGFFPSATYVVLSRALRDLGYEAPPELWRQISAERHDA